MTDPRNIFSDIPANLSEELVQTLAESDSVRIERIVSCGHSSPDGFWYDQHENEWVVVLRGAARLLFEGAAGPTELQRVMPSTFLLTRSIV